MCDANVIGTRCDLCPVEAAEAQQALSKLPPHHEKRLNGGSDHLQCEAGDMCCLVRCQSIKPEDRGDRSGPCTTFLRALEAHWSYIPFRSDMFCQSFEHRK